MTDNIYHIHSRHHRNVASGGGPPYDGDMSERVTRLEVEFEHVRKNLDEIKADQKQVLSSLGALNTSLSEMRGEMRAELAKRPTTGQFWSMVATLAGIALTVVLLILGGLAYLTP